MGGAPRARGRGGGVQAAEKIYERAEVLSGNQAALQLRYLQTLLELGGEKSTIVFPLPMDLIKPFLGADGQAKGAHTAPGPDLSAEVGLLSRFVNGSGPVEAPTGSGDDESRG